MDSISQLKKLYIFVHNYNSSYFFQNNFNFKLETPEKKIEGDLQGVPLGISIEK